MLLLLRGAYTLTTLVMSKNGKLSLGKIYRVIGSFSSLTFICVNCIWPRYQETNGYYVHDEARDHALVCWNHRFHCVFNRMLQYDWSLSIFICSLIGCSVFKLSDLDRLLRTLWSDRSSWKSRQPIKIKPFSNQLIKLNYLANASQSRSRKFFNLKCNRRWRGPH